ncbi:MAG: site-2 protease family protein [Clostridia bacterium]
MFELFTGPGTITEKVLYLLVYVFALFFSLTIHEYAHSHVALKEGDVTSKVMGRHTLNPFKHIDPIGMICLLLLGIGWAKPVPIDSRNFKNGKKSEVKVALAGILTNFIVGVCSVFFVALVWAISQGTTFVGTLAYNFIIKLFMSFASFNFMFAFFNIIPIYPLDGFRLVETFTKPYNKYVEFMKKYSTIILIVLLLTQVLYYYISFFAYGTMQGFINLFEFIFTKLGAL